MSRDENPQKENIAQNAYCSRNIYLQLQKKKSIDPYNGETYSGEL